MKSKKYHKYFGKLRKLNTLSKLFIIRKISGASMAPALLPGQLVVGLHWFRNVYLQDVVIFEHAGKEKIKRVKKINSDELYVVGDNADNSTDSRQFGNIKRNTVIAKVIWPRVKTDAS